MDRGIQPLLQRQRIAGTAVTLAIPGQDSTLLHHALGLLRPGDILVVDRLGDDKHACWGGGVTVAAKAAGALGGVVDGPCTDLTEIEDSDFPMWCRGMSPITTRLYNLGGTLNLPVSCGGVTVSPGDAIIADEFRRAGARRGRGGSHRRRRPRAAGARRTEPSPRAARRKARRHLRRDEDGAGRAGCGTKT